MAKRYKKFPFEDRYNNLTQNFGLKPFEAIREIENNREKFDETHQGQKRVHLGASNRVQLSRIAHTTTLATLTITVAGLLSTQFIEDFNIYHKTLLMIIIISEIMSLSFGMFDYYQTIGFHNRWAKAHHDITEEASAKFDKAELQTTSDLVNIQNKILSIQPNKTNDMVSHLMVLSALTGSVALSLLFYSYFFDFPNELFNKISEGIKSTFWLSVLIILGATSLRYLNRNKE